MNKLTIVIGNKNYSSWSLRPWLALKQSNIAFEEIRVPLYQENSKTILNSYSPAGKVPILKHGDLTIWDSLAICEYINEQYPGKHLWPVDAVARAHARAISAEMHSGFAAMRSSMSMHCRERFPGKGHNAETDANIERICAIWKECRNTYGKDGKFLFGHFTIADAMYAPVAIRFYCYDVALDSVCKEYMQTLLSLPAMQEWISAGKNETERLKQFELYQN